MAITKKTIDAGCTNAQLKAVSAPIISLCEVLRHIHVHFLHGKYISLNFSTNVLRKTALKYSTTGNCVIWFLIYRMYQKKGNRTLMCYRAFNI